MTRGNRAGRARCAGLMLAVTVGLTGTATAQPPSSGAAPAPSPTPPVVVQTIDTAAEDAATAAQARRGAPRRWPGRRITYFDASKNRAAVRKATRMWNRSGIRIRFVRSSSRRRADLLIRNSRDVPSGCGSGQATLGYPGPRYQAYVNVLKGSAKDGQPCALPGQTLVMLHELGHVLGLGHVSKGCSLMNPSHTNGVAMTGCLDSPAEAVPGRWWCRGIERRDLERARRLYGGRIRPVAEDPWCYTYDPIPAPGPVTAVVDGYGSALDVVRPADPTLPDYLASWALNDARGVAVHTAPGACAPVSYAPGVPQSYHSWIVPPGGAQREWLSLGPGAHCATVWSVDQLGRPSLSAAQVPVVVPGGRTAQR